MSQIPATTRQLKASAAALQKNADALTAGNGSLLLRFYSVECAMKERYLTSQRTSPIGDTSKLVGVFGSSGHDLDAGRKALRAPASVPAAPKLSVPDPKPVYGLTAATPRAIPTVVAVEGAHQVWRYGILHEGSEPMEAWLKQVQAWLGTP
jgi:hypothetical protein